jgi:type IV pilus assembly protein PilQ
MVKVGSMNRAKRILMIAGVAVLSVNGASASWFRHKQAEPVPQAAPAADAGMMLNAIEVETTPSIRLLLRTTGTPVYTSYSPAPARFVVDLTSTSKSPSLAIPSPLPAPISSVSVEDVVEMGTRLTRVTVILTKPSTPQAVASDNLVSINLPSSLAERSDDALPAVVPVIPATAQASAAPPVTDPEPVRVTEPVITTEPIKEAPQSVPVAVAKGSTLPKAKTLKNVTTTTRDGSLEVTLAADGELAYNAFKLESPARVVLDLTGVHNKLAKSSIVTGNAMVSRIRVAQFTPDVTRVVLDLNQSSDYHVATENNRLHVTFGPAAAVAAKSEPGAAPVAQTAVPEPLRTAQATPTTPEAAIVAPKPASTQEAKSQPVVDAPKAVADRTDVTANSARSVDVTEQVPAIPVEKMPTWKMPAKAVITAPAGQTAPPSTSGGSTKKGKKTGTDASPENVFSDPSASTSPVLGSSAPPAGATPRIAAGRTLSGGEKVYTGEPIDLNLKDADVKDVLRTFANLTGLNVAVDPGVTGLVTVDFTGVPWDQALDIILRQNNLTYVLDGNVMRIGYIARLAEEQRAQTLLNEQEKLNVQLTTVSRKLSYARAADVAGLLREIASPKAKLIVDARTNQLIISEIPQYLQTMQNLIDSVDVATRQVIIEARIVETSKTFLQQYGFTWGFGGKLDPSLGTGTGLVFPNRLDFTGGPFDFGPGNPVISTHMSNILGTFTLDLALNAAEAEGLVKVVSAPRVMTQDNVAASISSGFQIPLQTRINFTTTVQYVDASLTLTVTPQITEAGTVIMDISVQKLEPAVGLAIEGSAGTPLSTRTARTKLMVRDGGTSVIAGIYQTKENDARTRMPFVHQIPILGALFRTHDINSSHDELLIFITPRIVRNV